MPITDLRSETNSAALNTQALNGAEIFPVEDTQASVWDVRMYVEDSHSAAWHVRASVFEAYAALWEVVGPVVLTLSPLWNVRESVNAPAEAHWDTRQWAEDSLQSSWLVGNATAKTKCLSWSVRLGAKSASSTLSPNGGVSPLVRKSGDAPLRRHTGSFCEVA
jgi:hypothetical protein